MPITHPTRKRWSREELLLALNLYHKLTFGQFHRRHPVIIEAARKIARTPDSLAMKLSNFASLDPVQQLRGIRGLAGASHQDRLIWDEFHANLSEMAAISEDILAKAFEAKADQVVEVVPKNGIRLMRRPSSGGQDVPVTSTQRRGQDYFRNAVLNNFDNRCGVTGIAMRQLLVASHILPWSKHPESRLDIRNGLCLSRLHDAAFDQGLISFDDNLRLLLSNDLREHLSSNAIQANFAQYAGSPLTLGTEGLAPSGEYLAVHRKRFAF